MKTREEKALHLCQEYDRLMTSIAKCKSDIGDGLSDCDRKVSGPDGFDYIPDGKQTHLADAFDYGIDEDDEERIYLGEQDQLEIIGDCEGCLKAWTAIHERKTARKALGIVKRQIRMLGRGVGK